MDQTSEKKYSPVQPYDVTFSEHFRIYDQAEYHRDLNICNKDSIMSENSRFYKYYTLNEQNPVKVGGDC